MESCLLCLEINKEFVEGIKVDSTQWQELNIQNLIDKHLWVMENILPTAWLCNNCWQELYDFHKFYMRIKEAHMDFGAIMKAESETELQKFCKGNKEEHMISDDECNNNEENIESCINKYIQDSHLEPEIIIDQLVKTDNLTIIRDGEADIQNEDNITLKQRCKLRCTNNIQLAKVIETTRGDPLQHNKKSKKKKKSLISDSSCKPPPTTCKTEEPTIIQNPDDLLILEKSKVLKDSSDTSESFTDSDYEPIEEFARCAKKTTNKKSTKRRIRDRSKPQAKDIFLSKHFNMSCVICQTPMATFKILIKHFETVHKERPYAFCCNKKFYKRSLLLEHVNRHVDPNFFKCNKCDKVLSNKKALKTHQVRHLSDEEKKFSCDECGKNFAEQYILSNHIRSVHEMKYVKICDICGKTLRCRDIFERHMSEHAGKPIPPIHCEICGLLLAHKKALKRHMDIQHPVGGKQTHTCHICLKVSPNLVALKKHIRCTHNTGNIHKCTICQRGFKRAQTLRDHMATHTGTALYTCPWCPKTFNSNGCMHAHRKKHHPQEWEEAHRRKYSEKYKPPSAPMEIKNTDVL